MTAPLNTTWDALHLLRNIITRIQLEQTADLSTRQMNILLTVYLTPPPHTVKNLSEGLKISKPAVCRALDHLSKLGFVRRKKDEKDSRIVYVQRTVPGSVFLSEVAEIVMSQFNQPQLLKLSA